jgi:hypothetical protein
VTSRDLVLLLVAVAVLGLLVRLVLRLTGWRARGRHEGDAAGTREPVVGPVPTLVPSAAEPLPARSVPDARTGRPVASSTGDGPAVERPAPVGAEISREQRLRMRNTGGSGHVAKPAGTGRPRSVAADRVGSG